MSTHYNILGLKSDASQQEIKKAYFRLARELHPDKCSQEDASIATRAFQNLQSAYAVLSDPSQRRHYDATLQPISKPIPSPYTAPSRSAPTETELNPESLPQDLVDVLDSDASVLFTPYLNKYSERQLGAVLIRVCKMGKDLIAEEILKRYPALASVKVNHFGISGNLLFLAAASGNRRLVWLLIQKGTQVNVEGRMQGNPVNPLYIAVSGKHLGVVRELWEKKKSVVSLHNAREIFQMALDQDNPEMVSELLTIPAFTWDTWIHDLMENQSLPLVRVMGKHLNWRVRDEWITLPSLVIPHFGVEKIKELIGNKELDPFQPKFQGEDRKDALIKLFRAMGRSGNFELFKWFEMQYEEVRNGLFDEELLTTMFLGALELNPPLHIVRSTSFEEQFQFCRLVVGCLKSGQFTQFSSVLESTIYTHGAKCTALFEGLRADVIIRNILDKFIDRGIQSFSSAELETLHGYIADNEKARLLYGLKDAVKTEFIMRGKQ